jgi:hypothetical protein
VLTDCPNKDIKGAVFNVRRTSEVDQFDLAFPVEHNILVFDVSVHNQRSCMQVMDCIDNLPEDVFTFPLFHIRSELDVVEQIHARYTVRDHLNVVVDIILEEINHLDDVRVSHTVSSKVIHHMDLERDCA